MSSPTIFAISDIHLSHPQNLSYFSALPSYKDNFPANSGLILAGDVGESIAHLRTAIEISLQVFKYVWWVPGNHELYTLPKSAPSKGTVTTEEVQDEDAKIDSLKGQPRYQAFIRVCRSYTNVFTPEDDWVVFDPASPSSPVIHISSPSSSSPSPSLSPAAALICPLFTLYDYTFRPSHITSVEEALSWAEAADTYATDEALLFSSPYANKQTWSNTLISEFHTRLSTARKSLPASLPFILINHWPLSESVLHIPRIPRFSIWCGSRRTANWTNEFAPVSCVVSGHLHVRRTDWINGTRWEEVSLGYPRQWEKIRDADIHVADLLRQIHPAPEGSEERSSSLSQQEKNGEEDKEKDKAGGSGSSGEGRDGRETATKQTTTWRPFGGR